MIYNEFFLGAALLNKQNIQQKLEYMARAAEYLSQFEPFQTEDLEGAYEGVKAIRKVVYICLEEMSSISNQIVSNLVRGKADDQRSMLQEMINLDIIPAELANALLKILPERTLLLRETRIDHAKLLSLAKALPNILDGYIHFISIFLQSIR